MQKGFLYIFFSHTDFSPKIQIFLVIYTDFVLGQSGRSGGNGYLDNEGTRSGLAVSSAYPTHTNLAFPSHPHTRKMRYSSSMHHRPVSLRATHSSQVLITPSPLLWRGGGG